MVVVGIDPMDLGALAVFHTKTRTMNVIDMPVVKGKTRLEIDIPRLAYLLKNTDANLVYIEKMQPLPANMGGGQANFKRGGYLYLFRGICAALGLPLIEIGPREWQKSYSFRKDDTKTQSYLIASRLFPELTFMETGARGKQKIFDGRSDACLIAHYGAMRQTGIRMAGES
jgi:hypothetical protein